jgi:uncharacterized protein YwgA
MISSISPKEWTLLVINYADKDGLAPVKLQKTLFLLKQAYKFNKFYSFKPYNYGPFDIKIYEDVGELIEKGYVQKVSTNLSWSKYLITDEGSKIVHTLESRISKKQLSYVLKLVKWIEPLSFTTLITSIYKRYPRYRKNSVFIDS